MTTSNINIFDVIFNVNATEKFGQSDAEYFSTVGNRTLVIEKDGMKLFAITEDGCRPIPHIGQTTRTRQLIKAIEEKDNKSVRRITVSLLDQQMEEVSVMVFRMSGKFALHVAELKTYRRESFLQKGRDQLVYILDEKQDVNDVLTSIEYLEDILVNDRDEFFRPSAIKDNGSWKRILSSIVKEVRNRSGINVEFMGGSPDNGLFLLSTAIKPASTGAAQKVAKIMMAGGVNCMNMDIQFTLAEFPKEVDGVFAILNRKTSKKFNAANAVVGKIYQTRMFRDGKYAIKGTMMRPMTNVLKKVIGRNHAVLDVNEYNKSFGLNKKIGDKVSIGEIRVMSTDVDCGERPVRISNQLLSRVPENYLGDILDIVRARVDELAQMAIKAPQQLLPKYGLYSLMREIDPIEFPKTDYQGSAEKELKHQVRTIVRKGVTVPGAYLYHVPSMAIKFHECLISKKWADKSGVKIGDKVSFNIYPALFADDDESSNFLFSKTVVGYLDADAVSLSPAAAKAALRDFDGDKLVVTVAYILGEQSSTDYTETLSGERDPLLAETYSEGNAIDAFIKLGSSIGILDWWCEIAVKTNPQIDRKKLNHFMQADIYSKKHTVKIGFSMNDLRKYLHVECPMMWDGDKVKAHADVICRKSAKQLDFNVDAVDTKGMSEAMAATVKALKHIQVSKIKTQSQEAFRDKAYSILDPFKDKVVGLNDMKNAVVAYSKSFGKDVDIDVKKAAFRNLGRELKSKLGAESYTMFSLYLMICDDDFRSLFFPLMFSERDILKLVHDAKPVVFAGKVKTANIGNTIKAWRPRLIMDDGTIDNQTASITMAEFKTGNKITIKDGKIVMDRPANIDGICIDGEYTVKSCVPSYSKDGKTILKTSVIIGI